MLGMHAGAVAGAPPNRNRVDAEARSLGETRAVDQLTVLVVFHRKVGVVNYERAQLRHLHLEKGKPCRARAVGRDAVERRHQVGLELAPMEGEGEEDRSPDSRAGPRSVKGRLDHLPDPVAQGMALGKTHAAARSSCGFRHARARAASSVR